MTIIDLTKEEIKYIKQWLEFRNAMKAMFPVKEHKILEELLEKFKNVKEELNVDPNK